MKANVKVEYSVAVPAGTYFLGDPCYAVPNDDWMPLLEQTQFFDAYHEGKGGPVGEIRGLFVLGFGTKHGDGVYYDQFGYAYGVDAGMIGLTDVRLIKGDDNAIHGGQLVTFERPVVAHEDIDSGVLTFGKYVIETDPEEEDDDDYCYDCGEANYGWGDCTYCAEEEE